MQQRIVVVYLYSNCLDKYWGADNSDWNNQRYQKHREDVGDLSMTSAAFHFLTSFNGEEDFINMSFSPKQHMQRTITHHCLEYNPENI
jgi:hypothetical protein